MSLSSILRSRVWPAAWQLFVRAFVLVGLPLLAWGLDDYAGFFSEPARASYAAVCITQALALAWLVYITPPQPPPERHDDLPEWHAHMYEVILILAAYGDRRAILTWAENPAVRWVGVGITLIGVVLSIWANLTWANHLRRVAGDALADPVLLTEGPFKWIRYPGLLCQALYSLGFAVTCHSWIGLALMLPLSAIFVSRIRYFEKLYAGRYGQAWFARRRASRRILPFLY